MNPSNTTPPPPPPATPNKNRTTPRLAISNLSKFYGRFVALDDINLTIAPGEFVVLLGRNGAGKTTLLRILGLLLRQSRGEYKLGETSSLRLPVAERRRIGFVAHETFLYDELTVQENLEFFARLYGLPNPAERIREVLDEAGLQHRTRSLSRDLSRGLRQRLTLARAWLHRPDLMLLDEPATGLDIPTRERMHEWLAGCHRQGRTVVLSSHELRESMRPATRVILLEDGRVAFDGPNQPDRIDEMTRMLATGSRGGR